MKRVKNPYRQYGWSLRWAFSFYEVQRASSNHLLRRIAARLWCLLNLQGLGWAANGDRARWALHVTAGLNERRTV